MTKLSAIDPDTFYTESETADLIDRKPTTLQRDRWGGTGPCYHRIGGQKVRYLGSDLIAWLKRGRVETQQTAA